ncbi:hypothetical protein Scep_026111 [Stephania cephalantha]|uniref:Uncharacterized protein n=1 Tax=Stephania cephalantha TaxID=152367 RepID=A0AAP0EMQ8_9MAGN
MAAATRSESSGWEDATLARGVARRSWQCGRRPPKEARTSGAKELTETVGADHSGESTAVVVNDATLSMLGIVVVAHKGGRKNKKDQFGFVERV